MGPDDALLLTRRALLQLIVEQRQYAARSVRFFNRTVLAEHADLAVCISVLDLNAELLAWRRLLVGLREWIEFGEKARLVSGLVVGIRIDITHEIDAFRTIAVLDGKTDTVKRKSVRRITHLLLY